MTHGRVAIVHEWLESYAGSERVVAQLLRMFPGADLFAVVDFLPAVARAKLGCNGRIKTTFIQKLPFARRYFRSYLPLMPAAIRMLDVSNYDLIISSSHAVAKGVRTNPSQLHLSYVHTPMRYVWDMREEYLKRTGFRGISSWFADRLLDRLQKWDVETAKRVGIIVANSRYVAERIRRYWNREAVVIYPPVDISTFSQRNDKEEFYLAASRLVPYKRMELVVEAFNMLPNKRLVVIGDGPQLDYLRRKARKNVQVMGYQSTEVLVDYMQRARAFVFAAEEDFGITPLEAQACGTPVIAFGRGGALETIIGVGKKDPTGMFFLEQTADSIVEAVHCFEREAMQITPDACRRNAERFSEKRFQSEFGNFVERTLRDWKAGRRDSSRADGRGAGGNRPV